MQVMEAVNVMANDKLVGVYDYLGDECRGLYVEFMTHGEKKGVGWPVCQEKRVHLKVHIFLEKKKKRWKTWYLIVFFWKWEYPP